MNSQDIPFLSATELAEQIHSKQVSPVEAVEAYLSRIEQVDPKLNAYITLCGEAALAEARQAETDIGAGNIKGPLHGVPVGIKDQIHTRGIATSDASKIRQDFIPEEDATVVTNLKASGAILLGKLNMSEFALGDPISSAFGPARNPWDLDRNPGTSSTGSGAATAGFLCATSLGEDTGGSIRGPAANCGLAGIRPSWGRVSRYGVDGACWSIDTIGPISRTVADCAVTLGAIAGYDPKDPLILPFAARRLWRRPGRPRRTSERAISRVPCMGCRWELKTRYIPGASPPATLPKFARISSPKRTPRW